MKRLSIKLEAFIVQYLQINHDYTFHSRYNYPHLLLPAMNNNSIVLKSDIWLFIHFCKHTILYSQLCLVFLPGESIDASYIWSTFIKRKCENETRERERERERELTKMIEWKRAKDGTERERNRKRERERERERGRQREREGEERET